MDRETIIKLAQEAHYELVTKDYVGHMKQLDPWTMRLLERFANLIAQHERNAILSVIGENQCECFCSDVVRKRVNT